EKTDETAEQATAIETAVGKQAEPPLAEWRAALPEGARLVVEMRLQVIAIGGPRAGIDARAEQAIEGAVVRQLLGARQLEPREPQMRGIEIDGDDLGGIGKEIVEDVAAAGRDR